MMEKTVNAADLRGFSFRILFRIITPVKRANLVSIFDAIKIMFWQPIDRNEPANYEEFKIPRFLTGSKVNCQD
jgi:hypothetical protein